MTEATHYNSSSKGPTLIAGMNYRHLENARDTLAKRNDPARAPELEAINTRIAALDVEFAEQEANGGVAKPAFTGAPAEEEAAPPGPREAVMGDNNPPEPTQFEAFKTHLDDLRLEAGNWLDGTPVESQAQADEVSRLMDEYRKAGGDADKARAAEKAPHLDASRQVDEKWRPLISGASLCVETCKKVLQPWLTKLANDQREAAEAARKEAEAKQAEAAAAVRAAEATDIAAREAAETKVAEAKEAERAARQAEQARPQATGGARATTLRSYFTPVLTDGVAASRHYWQVDRQAVEAFMLTLAAKDVASGKRSIPGFRIDEEKRVV